MRTRHAACLVRVCTLLALVLPVLPGPVAAAPPRQGSSSSAVVYHELTQRSDGSRPIESLVLSGDGRRAIWAESPRDPPESNRVYALDIDGGQPRQIDAYRPICRCATQVDVSNDGNTVVSTEGVRIRVLAGVDTFREPREVLRLANDVISTLRISGNGRIVVFTVSRDSYIFEPNPRKRGASIPRGVWAVSAEGGEPIQLAGIREIAAVSGVPVAELAAAHEFHRRSWENALDVSDDGRRIIFGASVGSAVDAGFSITEAAPLTQLIGPMEGVYQVAVSGDGQTVAFATEEQGRPNLTVVTGSTKRSLPSSKALRIHERLQLSRDGTQLLTIGRCCNVLVELATLATRELIPQVPLNREGDSSLFMGYFRFRFQVTMNAAGTRILYVTNRYAANRGNLAVIELGATDSSDAPLVRGLNLDPDTIPRDGSKGTSVSTEISWDGTLIGVWLEVLRDGARDTTFGDSGLRPMQDTVGPDPGRLQGIFAADLVSSDKVAAPGPRQLRLIIESQAEDGRRHGTVFDADKTLTVAGPAASGGVYRGTGGGQTINIEVGEDRTPAQLVIGSVTAEIVLEAAANGHSITGGSLSYDVQRVFDNGVEKESFTSSKGYGALTSYPGGAWGEVLFTGPITMQWENIEPQKYEEWDEGFDVALDSSGQLVLCPDTEDEPNPQAAVARCLATAMVVLRPVVDEPPQSP